MNTENVITAIEGRKGDKKNQAKLGKNTKMIVQTNARYQ